ncbi:M48 family metallopeptidase [Aquirhabdus parva]|uniref:M48 family peptidase n=1 Tax=Aquirhabdus parva TaxID=2283318 RepID=A0A345P5H6_9GAMM|nr:SprT family zinc-dependent metalloprotease [Aquirhabdus parva]AXI02535.1 M48 family peptidase [Aquirhabdus parva]
MVFWGRKAADDETDLPEIEWRVNSRAKRLRLTLKSGRVWVTIPPRTSDTTVRKFLKETQLWLKENWAKQLQIKRQHEQHLADHPQDVSQSITNNTELSLPALNQTWRLEISDAHKRVTVRGETIFIPEVNASASLKQWVKHQAQSYLPLRLAELATIHHFQYTGCTIRHARTRWGSCTRQGKINLNASLILLAPELLDYVLLHELCHTRQFNHSPLFWAEMMAVCPTFANDRQLLKKTVLPQWWSA